MFESTRTKYLKVKIQTVIFDSKGCVNNIHDIYNMNVFLHFYILRNTNFLFSRFSSVY